MIQKIQIKDVKKGEFIHLKNDENSPIWIRGHYDATTKSYSLISYEDANREIFRKRTAFVYIENYNY